MALQMLSTIHISGSVSELSNAFSPNYSIENNTNLIIPPWSLNDDHLKPTKHMRKSHFKRELSDLKFTKPDLIKEHSISRYDTDDVKYNDEVIQGKSSSPTITNTDAVKCNDEVIQGKSSPPTATNTDDEPSSESCKEATLFKPTKCVPKPHLKGELSDLKSTKIGLKEHSIRSRSHTDAVKYNDEVIKGTSSSPTVTNTDDDSGSESSKGKALLLNAALAGVVAGGIYTYNTVAAFANRVVCGAGTGVFTGAAAGCTYGASVGRVNGNCGCLVGGVTGAIADAVAGAATGAVAGAVTGDSSTTTTAVTTIAGVVGGVTAGGSVVAITVGREAAKAAVVAACTNLWTLAAAAVVVAAAGGFWYWWNRQG